MIIKRNVKEDIIYNVGREVREISQEVGESMQRQINKLGDILRLYIEKLDFYMSLKGNPKWYDSTNHYEIKNNLEEGNAILTLSDLQYKKRKTPFFESNIMKYEGKKNDQFNFSEYIQSKWYPNRINLGWMSERIIVDQVCDIDNSSIFVVSNSNNLVSAVNRTMQHGEFLSLNRYMSFGENGRYRI